MSLSDFFNQYNSGFMLNWEVILFYSLGAVHELLVSSLNLW